MSVYTTTAKALSNITSKLLETSTLTIMNMTTASSSSRTSNLTSGILLSNLSSSNSHDDDGGFSILDTTNNLTHPYYHNSYPSGDVPGPQTTTYDNITTLFSFSQDTSPSHPQEGQPSHHQPHSLVTIVLLSLLFFVIVVAGIVGNALVVFVVLRDRKMRQSVTNLLILNLAMADLLIMALGVPEIVQFMLDDGWLLGPVPCRLNRFLLVVCLYVSVLSLVSVCVERCLSSVGMLPTNYLRAT